MAIQKFQDSYHLSKYYFDTNTDTVMSLHSGSPRTMKWVKSNHWSPRRVGMVNDRGFKVSYRYDQIKNMLKPAERVVDAAGAVSGVDGLVGIKPSFDYVLYSVKNRCSQYFFAGTSIQEALDRLARRGEHVAHDDVRILNTQTGRVQKLGIKTITTYTLI